MAFDSDGNQREGSVLLSSLCLCLFLYLQNQGSGCELPHCDQSRYKMHKVPREPQREDVSLERLASGHHVVRSDPPGTFWACVVWPGILVPVGPGWSLNVPPFFHPSAPKEDSDTH